ncbi:MAG: phosphoribosylformylglycinamidine synthase subunit PurL [Methanocellales archaeon]|nr:phosphoribosylformylglycinamidine synthase subunit PurL [Methanocellales archaeon]
MELRITKEIIAELGLSEEEFEKIKGLLGREPNYTELGMFSAMWSEHCSYKSSKPVLKLFPTTGEQVLQGPGENAGVVDIGNELAVVFKIESHNHPAAIEPYEASATGGGGCIRDIITMGARPVALLDSLRFGRLTGSRVKYLLAEVARGFTTYANISEIPVVGGDVYFDESYEGNPLVNAMTVGFMRHKDMAKARATGVGNLVLIVGGATGRDGVAGAAFASRGLDEESGEKRSAVAVGDPKMGKLVREACLELIQRGHVVGMQDMGAAGLTCSVCETAYKGGTGIEIDISLVPRKEEKMTPYEVMLSESQERMLVIIEKDRLNEVKEIFSKWGVLATVIGRVTDDGMVRVKERNKVVAEVPAAALVEAPVYHLEEKVPEYLKVTREFNISDIPEPDDYAQVLLNILSSPSIASKEWIYKKGDPKLTQNIQVGPGSDAAVIRLPGTEKLIAVTVDCNARYVYLNPYMGGEIAVAEAARNLVCAGAKPLAITDCLNFGNPRDPEVFWQFKQSVLGISEACRALETPVVSGNVSFNNESPKGSVDPTPVIGMVGLIEDSSKVMTQHFKNEGDAIFILGETKEELGGSEYLKLIHGLKKGDAPAIDLEVEKRLQETVLQMIKEGLINSAHDCSEGGLAVALAECCISHPTTKFGATINLDSLPSVRTDALLFGESQSRVVVSCSPEKVDELKKMAQANNVPAWEMGKVGGDKLSIGKWVDIDIAKLDRSWRKTIDNSLERT